MNPSTISGAQPCEMRPLQGYNLDPGYPRNSGYPSAAVQLQRTTVSVGAVQDHVVWSLFSLVYGNLFCLGLAALIFSIKSRDRKVVGDVEGARQHASTARRLNIAATCIMSICLIIFIILVSVVMSIINSYHYNYNYIGKH